jgi:hypothetical protein
MARRSKVVRIRGAGLEKYRKRLLAHGVLVARNVAEQATPALNREMHSAFDGGRTAYGAPRPLGKTGRELSLVRTGRTRATLRFDNVGSLLRVKLTTPYAKYLVGRFSILPRGQEGLPASWQRALREITSAVVSRIRRAA